MAQLHHNELFKAAQRAGALLCVLLVCLVSLISVAHVHAKSQNTQDRSCSVCALAHSGVAQSEVSALGFVFASTALVPIFSERAHLIFLGSSFYIRPPPAV